MSQIKVLAGLISPEASLLGEKAFKTNKTKRSSKAGGHNAGSTVITLWTAEAETFVVGPSSSSRPPPTHQDAYPTPAPSCRQEKLVSDSAHCPLGGRITPD